MRIEKNSWLFTQPIVHRGAHDIEVPENSMRSFREAIKMNYAIELDVHLTVDGNLIVFHDDNTERMTGVRMDTINMTSKDLNELRLFNTGEKIPLFKEVLELVDGRVPLLIEIKNTSKVGKIEERLLEALEDYKGKFALQAFNPFRVKWLKKNNPNIAVGQLSGLLKEDNDLNSVERFFLKNLMMSVVIWPDFVNYEIEGLNKLVIKFLRLVKYPVLSWTARNFKTYSMALKLSENTVFEGFTPGRRSL